ncbi:MAG TPA: MgtC/SapB family protein [Rubricoccaceae bacterium]
MLDTALADLLSLAQGVLALALGGAVGWERERKNKGAGFRTMMLVSFASFLLVKVSLIAGESYPGSEMVRTDPVRSIQAVATALGFVGAGIIYKHRSEDRTRGLTTAAAVLAVSPVGIAVALGRPVLAIGATVLLVLVLDWGQRFEERFARPAP